MKAAAEAEFIAAQWKRGLPEGASACTPGYYNSAQTRLEPGTSRAACSLRVPEYRCSVLADEGVTGANEGLYGRKSAARLAGVPHQTNPLRWFATLERRRLEGSALQPFDVV